MRPVAQKAGICKIIPPEGWSPPKEQNTLFRSHGKLATRVQRLHTLQVGRRGGAQPRPCG